jgi:hypothetical protein
LHKVCSGGLGLVVSSEGAASIAGRNEITSGLATGGERVVEPSAVRGFFLNNTVVRDAAESLRGAPSIILLRSLLRVC